MLSSLLISLAAIATPVAPSSELVAVKAGTIHAVDGGRVITGGGTVLIQDGKIVGVGEDEDLPAGVRVVDYGPSAVIVPGLVAVDSSFGSSTPSGRTAEPGLAAIDGYDPYGSYLRYLAHGVTTAYVAPARNRLIAGNGAVVKLGGEPGNRRVLSERASIHGSISEDARRTPGYWEPPVPATVDVGLGVERPQLPRTTMGAIVALRELLALAANPTNSEEYGPYTGRELAELMKAGLSWRMRAESPEEIRALVEFFQENGLPLVLDGASGGGEMVDWLAARKVPVIVHSPVRPNGSPRDLGKGEDDRWPDVTLAARLAAAGVPVAVAPNWGGSVRDLRFHASMAKTRGLDAGAALASVTENAARILGVADRVGSLAAGKDADLVVLSGDPLGASASVLATWVDGEVAYAPGDLKGAAARAAGASEQATPVVLQVEVLHTGDGEVLSPGEVLIQDGRIVEVGRRVARPIGCTLVSGYAAMPGIVDAYGHLGLEGSSKTPGTGFKLARIVEPGDLTDRRVARAGVTTVLMTPRGMAGAGTPSMAYKPAAEDLEHMVLADPAALHLTWMNDNRLEAGAGVRGLIQKAVEYRQSWAEYEAKLAEWEAQPREPEATEESSEEEEKEDEGDEEKKDDDEDKDKKKRKKKGEEPPQPVTGVWLAHASQEGGEPARLRLQVLQHEDGRLEGRLRCDALSQTLVVVEGRREEHGVELSGQGSFGSVTLTADTSKEEGKLVGKASGNGRELEFTAEQTSKEYLVVRRTPRFDPEEGKEPAEPKDKPRPPRTNDDLEPMRGVLDLEVTAVVRVERADEILACVAAFEEVGVAPVLMGAEDAWKVADQLVGRVRGVLLSHRVVQTDARMGLAERNRYAELARAGIPVAFHSAAEEGAAELPLIAAYAVSQGMSPTRAIEALTAGAAQMMSIGERVGRLAPGMDADVLLLDGDPLELGTQVLRVWVSGREVRLH
jgi:imidazolonepropionase-like amidohydrolase